ncbi:MAG: hypothetical protein HY897_14180 [Deltaproteobacteria bacterium]|nr:hypothetical protein [Deltaproteobacteria bacterium]
MDAGTERKILKERGFQFAIRELLVGHRRHDKDREGAIFLRAQQVADERERLGAPMGVIEPHHNGTFGAQQAKQAYQRIETPGAIAGAAAGFIRGRGSVRRDEVCQPRPVVARFGAVFL